MTRMILPMLLLISSQIFSNHTAIRYLEGRYVSRDSRNAVIIDVKRNRLKVRGLPDNRGWRSFYRIRNNSWEDRRGNRIRIRSDQSFYYRSIVRNFNMMFYKDSSIRRNGYYSDERYRDYGRNNNDRNGYFRNDRSTSDVHDGRWYCQELNLYLTLDLRGDKLRVTMDDSGRWTEYYARDRIWYDDRGNSIRIQDRNTLIWQEQNGRRTYRLSRSRN